MFENVGITHVWPYNPDAEPISQEREEDVWSELRGLTFDDDLRGHLAFLVHAEDTFNPKTGWSDFHADTCDVVLQKLYEDDVVSNCCVFFKQREVNHNIQRPATKEWSYEQPRSAARLNEPTPIVTVPAEPARVETAAKRVPVHLGSKLDAQDVVKKYLEREIRALVLWEPDFSEEPGLYLRYLPWVHEKCPDLPIYVFHAVLNEKHWGVERGGRSGSWKNSFHTKSEALTVPENVDVVVRGLCNVGSVSMWGALPKHGKSYLFLSIMKALLSGKPWLDYFEVSQAKRVVYLVPEVGLRGVMKRLRNLNVVDHLYDPTTNIGGALFVQTLSSRDKLKLDDTALLEAVKGADVFVDPLIRYIEGEENNASDQRMLSNKLLGLISAEARSVWCAHHAPKAFKGVTDITTQNVLRGTGEFAAFPDIIFGVLKMNDETSRLYIKCTDARDDDEYLGDFEVEMRPWIDETGDMKLVVAPGTGTPLREQKRTTKRTDDPDRQAKIDFARSLNASLRETTTAVNEKFGSNHGKSTVSRWLNDGVFDEDLTQ